MQRNTAELKAALKAVLLERIPLTLALGLDVEEAGAGRLRLRFPLAPNHNHKDTAFGGSLYCAAVLAAWGLLWCACREAGVDAEAVVASSSERFLRPVHGDFTAECEADAAELRKLLDEIREHGSGRLRLKSRILCQNDFCMAFDGAFIVRA